jgi:hypothetical protein
MIRIASVFVVVLLVGCEGGRGGMLFGDAGGSGSGSGRPCGGFSGGLCTSNEFCDFGRNTCGVTDEQGTCRQRPTACDDQFAPVCGCDGVVHSNQCDANASGADVDASGSCPVGAGELECGFRFCDKATQYCERGVSDIGGEPDSFVCEQLPSSCGATPSCGCLTQEPCGSFCSGSQSIGLTLTCPGG